MKNKYNATKTVYNGIKYDSKKEANYAAKLDMLKNASGNDKVIDVKRQIKYSIDINGKHICNYFLDFEVKYPNRVEYVDVKGMKTAIYKLKKKLVEAVYGIKIIEI